MVDPFPTNLPRVGRVHSDVASLAGDGWMLSLVDEMFELTKQGSPSDSDGWIVWADQGEIPSIAWFTDADGIITLIGPCGHRTVANIPRGVRTTWRFRRGIISSASSIDFRRITGLRTEVPELRRWVGGSWIDKCYTAPLHENEFAQLSVTIQPPPKIPLAHKLNLSLRPAYREESHRNGVALEEVLWAETLTKREPRAWSEHRDLHSALQQLITVATWSSPHVESIWAAHSSSFETMLDGQRVPGQWARVVEAARQPAAPEPEKFLFNYSEILGPIGVRRWLRLRSDFKTGIMPLLQTTHRAGPGVELALAQASIGLEKIGYRIALECGRTPNQAGHESHTALLGRVWNELRVRPPGITKRSWLSLANDCYQATKHANREVPELLDFLETIRVHSLIFRSWVAQRLGVRLDLLEERLNSDRRAQPTEIYSPSER